MKKVLNRNNLIFILILMVLFNLIMPTVSYAANASINYLLKETIAGWYMILRALTIGVMLILILLIVIRAAINRNGETEGLLKLMIKDWLIAFFLVIFIHYFMMMAIDLNESAVAGAEALGQKLSGMEEGQEISLYESTISKAYEVKFKPGTIGMILYMMLVYYTYKFVLVYLKRYVNVIMLVLIAPIVCCVHGFKKVLTGKGLVLKKWIKEFIYNVFLQSLHAIMYASLVGLTLKFSDETESFIGAILTMILLGVIFKVDKLVRKIFNAVGGNTSVSISKVKGLTEDNLSTAKQIISSSTTSDGIDMSQVMGGFGNDLNSKLHTAASSIKTKAISGINMAQDSFGESVKIAKGDYKHVSDEEIAKEQEKMDNAGILGKTWYTIVGAPRAISNTIKTINAKTKEFKAYLENKKTQVIEYVQDLQKDVETIRSIPKLIENARKMPSLVMQMNPKNKKHEYDKKFEAIFDIDVNIGELQKKIKTLIDMSLGEITSSTIVARGYEALLRCPKIGMMLLAEQNYKNMIHPEIPVEERRVVKGYKTEVMPRQHFSNFGNRTIENLEQIIVFDFSRINSYMRSLSRVAVGVKNETITYRSVPENADKTIIQYKGAASARKKVYANSQIAVQGLKSFKSDTQMAININLLNQLKRARDMEKLSNLTPEMLKTLEAAGMVIRIEANGNFQGGYILLNRVIENERINKRVNDFLANNQQNPLAQKLNRFLNENPDSDIALRISNYLIDNPDNILVKVIDNIVITEDGRIIQKIESFGMDGQIPSLAQLGEIQQDRIVQIILTEEGQVVKQVIDFQGDIVSPAVDENGNIVEFSISENGLTIQTVVTPEGDLIQQVLSQDGTTIKPIMFDTDINQVQNIGDAAMEVLEGQGIVLSPEERQESIRRAQIKSDLMEISQAVSLNLSTGEVQSVIGIEEETEILTMLVDNIVAQQSYDQEAEKLNRLNELLGQISIHQGEQLTAELLERQMDKVLVERVVRDKKELQTITAEDVTTLVSGLESSGLISSGDDIGLEDRLSSAMEERRRRIDYSQVVINNEVLNMVGEVFSTEDISDTAELMAYLENEGSHKISDLARALEVASISQGDDTLQLASGNDIIKGVDASDSLRRGDKKTADTTLTEFEKIMSALSQENSSSDTIESKQTESTFDAIMSEIISTQGAMSENDNTQATDTQSLFETIMTEVKGTPSTLVDDSNESANSLLEAIEQLNAKTGTGDAIDALYETVGTQSAERKKEFARMEIPKFQRKAKNNKSDSEQDSKTIKVHVIGAVQKPGDYDVKYGIKVFEVINKYAGGFTEKADISRVGKFANKPVDEKNTMIEVPRLPEDDSVGTIECYIDGAVNSPGWKTLEKNATVADLITAANRLTDKANMYVIEINAGMRVQPGYVLSDQDRVFIPEITIEELDKQKGINTQLVQNIIRQEYEQYRKRNQTTLEELKQNKKVRKFILDKIAKALSEQKIKLTPKEIEKRFDLFIDDRIEAAIKRTQDKVNDILENITVVSDSQISGGQQTYVEGLLHELAERLDLSKVGVKIPSKQGVKKQTLSYTNGNLSDNSKNRKIQRTNDIMAQIEDLLTGIE